MVRNAARIGFFCFLELGGETVVFSLYPINLAHFDGDKRGKNEYIA